MNIKKHLTEDTRHRICDIKKALSAEGYESRSFVDIELCRLALAGDIVLYPGDDPLELTEADRVSAVWFGGENKYFVYLI